MTSVAELQHRIQKTRGYLHRLEAELHRAKHVAARKETEVRRIERLKKAFKKKYPHLEIDRSILRLVGTELYNPPSEDKAVEVHMTGNRRLKGAGWVHERGSQGGVLGPKMEAQGTTPTREGNPGR